MNHWSAGCACSTRDAANSVTLLTIGMSAVPKSASAVFKSDCACLNSISSLLFSWYALPVSP